MSTDDKNKISINPKEEHPSTSSTNIIPIIIIMMINYKESIKTIKLYQKENNKLTLITNPNPNRKATNKGILLLNRRIDKTFIKMLKNHSYKRFHKLATLITRLLEKALRIKIVEEGQHRTKEQPLKALETDKLKNKNHTKTIKPMN